VGLCLGDHPLRLGASLRDRLLGLQVGLADRLLCLVLRLADDLVLAVEHVLGVVDLGRQRVPHLVEQLENVTARHHATRGHRHTACLLHDRDELVEGLEDLVHVRLPPSPRLLVCLLSATERWRFRRSVCQSVITSTNVA
jgi:hypothetical protein